MRFSTVLMTRHYYKHSSALAMMRHHQQFKMAAVKPEAVHIVYSGCHIELHINFDEIVGQSILHCDGDP